MKKGSHASPEERKRMKEAQLRARDGLKPLIAREGYNLEFATGKLVDLAGFDALTGRSAPEGFDQEH